MNSSAELKYQITFPFSAFPLGGFTAEAWKGLCFKRAVPWQIPLFVKYLSVEVILLVKADKFSLGVKGSSVMSGTRAMSVQYSNMKNNMYFSCSYSDPSFYEECKAEYLKQREEYRATGIKKKRQKFTPNVWLKLKMNFL